MARPGRKQKPDADGRLSPGRAFAAAPARRAGFGCDSRGPGRLRSAAAAWARLLLLMNGMVGRGLARSSIQPQYRFVAIRTKAASDLAEALARYTKSH